MVIAQEEMKESEQERSAKTQAREILWYFVFLIIFSVTAMFGENNQDFYWFRDKLRDQLINNEFPFPLAHIYKGQMDSASVSDMYAYIFANFYGYIYSANAYDARNDYPVNQYGTTNRKGWMLGYGDIVGAIRIGQVRIKPEKCTGPLNLKKKYGNTLIPSIDTFNWTGTTGTKCYYQTEEVLDPVGSGKTAPAGRYIYNRDEMEPAFVSTVTSTRYPAPAYNVLLPRLEAGAECPLDLVPMLTGESTLTSLDPEIRDSGCNAGIELMRMFENNYFDLQTRAVYLDINVYNYMLDRMAVSRMLFELRPGGGVIPSTDVDIIKPYIYWSNLDYGLITLEAITMCFVFYYLYIEIRMLYKFRFEYFYDIGNIPHFTNLCLFIAVWGYKFSAMAEIPDTIVVDDDMRFVNMRSAADLIKVAISLNAFNVFLSWCKVFKYLSFSPQFAQVTKTLARAAAGLGGFFLVMAIVLFGSAQAFLLAFGSKVSDYRNLQESLLSLIRALLLDFDLQELRDANLWLGPIFFVSFVMLGVFVLLNMFIAIISDAYDSTKEDLTDEKLAGEKPVGTYIWLYVIKILNYIPGMKALTNKFTADLQATLTGQLAGNSVAPADYMAPEAFIAPGGGGGGGGGGGVDGRAIERMSEAITAQEDHLKKLLGMMGEMKDELWRIQTGASEYRMIKVTEVTHNANDAFGGAGSMPGNTGNLPAPGQGAAPHADPLALPAPNQT